MKYKVMMLTLIGSMLFGLAGCQKEQKEPEVIEFHDVIPEETPIILREEQETEESEAEETETEVQTEEAITPFCDREVVEYQVSLITFEENNVKITYPQLTDMLDTDLMEQINEDIRRNIVDKVVEEGLTEDESCITYQVEVKTVTQGTGILSIAFYGYQEYAGAAHPASFMKTLNIDLTTGENVRLKDYADIEQIVSSLELGQGYQLLNEVDKEDFSAFLNNGYVTDYAITLLDYDIDFSQGELIPAGYSYIKDNHPVLCIETEHAMGDYAEVMFDMQLGED